MTDLNTIQKEIENKSKELLRIHNNTLWYGISEIQANLLGDRMNTLEKEIESLRELTLTINREKMTDLNKTEIAILKLIASTSEENGGDFTSFNDVMELASIKWSVNQVKGYVGSLQKKGYLVSAGLKNKEDVPNMIYVGENAEFLTEYLD